MNTISLGVTTWLWASPFNTTIIDELFSKISSMGFDFVEIAVEDPSIINADRVKEAMNQYNLKVIVCGAFGPSRDLTSEDPLVHQNCFNYIESCLDLCVAWGSPILAGPLYSAVGKARMLPDDQRRQEWELAVKNVRIACEMAAKKGIDIAIEPLNRFESDMVNNVKDVKRMIAEINHRSAKIMLDSFHMNIEERNAADAIRDAGDLLVHFQVSENYRGVPGTGTTPWNQYFDTLKEIGYTKTLSIESFTPKNTELAGAVCIWKPFTDNQDDFAIDGLKFIKSSLGTL